MPMHQLTRKQNKEHYSKSSYLIFCCILKIFYMNEVVLVRRYKSFIILTNFNSF